MPEQSDFAFLKEYYPEHEQEILDWERNLGRAKLVSQFAKNDAVKLITAQLNKLIEYNEGRLMKDKTLNEVSLEAAQKRRDVMTQNECYRWFISLFTNASMQVKTTQKNIKRKIKDIKDYENMGTGS